VKLGAAFLVVILTVVTLPVPAHAQSPGRPWRIGFLGDGSAQARASNTLDPLREGLRDLGYREQQNIAIEVRWSEGRRERLPELARELVRLNVDVIVTHGIPAVLATKSATTTIPIVIGAAADLLGAGIISSLSHPGGNVTGINDQTTDLSAKEVDILRDALPRMKRVAVLWNRANPGAVMTSKAIQTAARDTGLHVISLAFERPEELNTALDEAVKDRAEAVIVTHDTMTVGHRGRIAELALARRLPTISASSLFAAAGGLMNYGPDLAQMFKRAATFVDKILKGAKPADLPVEQPTKFQLVINVRTAKALGLTLPQSLLLRADHVIE